ncbi:MAG TPA: hypothetical protein VJ346_04095, partial [Bacteroidales bacterium]|nr:hypothetical protein [Bacteroidales bacterium]
MNINRNNYEVYVIDYFDGKLDPVQTAELMYFLSQNPDLEYEFNAFENIKLPEANLIFSDKEDLKKKYSDFSVVTDTNFEELCIAEIEGDLDEKSQGMLFQYLEKNPEKNRDLELYRKTILKPDESLVFPGLRKLKKHKVIPLLSDRRIYYPGIAAALLVVVLLTFVFRRSPESDLNTSSVPDRENAVKKIESFTPQTEKEEISSIETNVIKESYMKSLQDSHVDSYENENIRPASGDDIEAINSKIKPIVIQRIDHIPYASGLALLKKDQPVQSYDDPSVQQKKTLAEFIKERFVTTAIFKSGENLNVWTLAQASLKGINYLTESDIQISRKLDSDGQIS